MSKYSPINNAILTAIQNSILNKPYLISSQIPLNLDEVAKRNPFLKTATVLIPLCNINHIPSIIFTLRTHTVGTHKGQVSFPGGHIMEGESVISAAIRESVEELGESLGAVRILGTAQTVPALTGTLVTPVLGFIENDFENLKRLTPEENEVERIFSRSLDELMDPHLNGNEFVTQGKGSITFPFYGSGKEKIWGLTAMILHSTLSNVIMKHVTKIK